MEFGEITPDSKTIVFSYTRTLSNLFLARRGHSFRAWAANAGVVEF
jgi:hypothetical protein